LPFPILFGIDRSPAARWGCHDHRAGVE